MYLLKINLYNERKIKNIKLGKGKIFYYNAKREENICKIYINDVKAAKKYSYR